MPLLNADELCCMYKYPCVVATDALVKKLEELEKTADMYRGLMAHSHRLLKGFFDLSQAHRGQ